MSYSTTISYDTALQLTFSSTFVEVASNTLRLKDQGGGTYTTTPQLVLCSQQFGILALSSFSEVSTVPGNTSITYLINMNGISYYYNSTNSSWAVSNGTSAQSSTAAVINSNASTLISGLNLLTTQYFGLSIYLTSTSGTARPVLTSDTIGFTWNSPQQTVMNVVAISAYLSDLAGNLPTYNAANPVKLTITAPYGFMHGTNFIQPFTKSFAFNSSGVCSASCIETATPGVALRFAIDVYDSTNTTVVFNQNLFNAIVPNQASIALTNLSSCYPYNFG